MLLNHYFLQAIAFEDEQAKHRAYDPTTANSDFYHQADGANPNAKPAVDTRGYVWVTKDGQMVANASNQSFNELPPPPTPRHVSIEFGLAHSRARMPFFACMPDLASLAQRVHFHVLH